MLTPKFRTTRSLRNALKVVQQSPKMTLEALDLLTNDDRWVRALPLEFRGRMARLLTETQHQSLVSLAMDALFVFEVLWASRKTGVPPAVAGADGTYTILCLCAKTCVCPPLDPAKLFADLLD